MTTERPDIWPCLNCREEIDVATEETCEVCGWEVDHDALERERDYHEDMRRCGGRDPDDEDRMEAMREDYRGKRGEG